MKIHSARDLNIFFVSLLAEENDHYQYSQPHSLPKSEPYKIKTNNSSSYNEYPKSNITDYKHTRISANYAKPIRDTDERTIVNLKRT